MTQPNVVTRYLTLDIEGLESFNDKCNQLSDQGWFPTSQVITSISGDMTRYIQQWSKVIDHLVKINTDSISEETM